jgi:hypothetical protein
MGFLLDIYDALPRRHLILRSVLLRASRRMGHAFLNALVLRDDPSGLLSMRAL